MKEKMISLPYFLRDFWEKVALNRKFSLLILCVLALPIAVVSNLVFLSLMEEEQEHIALATQQELDKLQSFAYSNANTANAVISLVHSNPQLVTALSSPLSTQELIGFHALVTPYFESISVTNPYIRSLRIYCEGEYMPERYPVFVDSQRVAEEDWFETSTPDYMDMRVNYSEELSTQISQYSGEALISFYQGVQLPQGHKAVIEVSYTMERFFGEVFSSNGTSVCVVEYEGELFLWAGSPLAESMQSHVMAMVSQEGEFSLGTTLPSSLDNDYLISGHHCTNLGLTYYIVSNLEEELSMMFAFQLLFYLTIILVLLLFGWIFEQIAHMLLKRIYYTIDAMQQLELGNTLVQIEQPGQDELGQLQRYFNQMVVRIDELIDQESKRAILEKDAELKALQNQINAHFLYNVLNNIEMMAIIDENYLIADSVTALARLLRYSMKWEHQIVPLDHELDYVRDYIQLFNMRFDNEITLICDIDDLSRSAFIPKMSVQPVVENAIIHGLEIRLTGDMIRIAASVEEGVLTIGITDTGIGMDPGELETLRERLASGTQGSISGIGLNNVRERIETRFGGEYGIDIQSKQGEYTKVTLTMPYLTDNLS